MKRGFKAQSERRSVEMRKHLGLDEHAPLNAFDLATYLQIRVRSAAEIPGVSKDVLRDALSAEAWSAFTLKIGSHYMVVYDHNQSKPRINSVLMHELAHITLGHSVAKGHKLSDGSFVPSHFDQEQEDEADWLGGALLLPRPALIHIRNSGWCNQTAGNHYMVSNEMLTYRFRMTGVDIQLGRTTG